MEISQAMGVGTTCARGGLGRGKCVQAELENMMLEFQVGDKAVYPAQGVAEVVGIDQKEISGRIQKFYVLRVLDSDMRILVPVDKAEQVGLREVVQEDQIREVYDILKEKELHVDKQTWNRRYRGV